MIGTAQNKGDLVEVHPEHSLEEDDDSWWAVPLSRAGPRAVSSGGGLVPKNKLEPLSDAESAALEERAKAEEREKASHPADR